MIRGWTATEDILALQHIGRKFQYINNTDTHRYSVTKAVMQWATTLGLEIDQGIYLGKVTLGFQIGRASIDM